MSFRSSKLSELSTPIISSQLVSKPASQQVSQLASEPTTLPASQPVSQLASRPASQSSESVSPVSQSVSQPTDQPTITLVHGPHEQPIEQTTQTVKAKTNQLTSQPTNRGADLPNYSQNKRLRPPVPRILHQALFCEQTCEQTANRLWLKIAQSWICTS